MSKEEEINFFKKTAPPAEEKKDLPKSTLRERMADTSGMQIKVDGKFIPWDEYMETLKKNKDLGEKP